MSLLSEEQVAQLEAVLFAAGEPLEIKRIAATMELDIQDVQDGLEQLQERLAKPDSGICLLRLGSRYQLCTKQVYAGTVREVLEVKKNTPLSPAAFEVLAVIAYNQPITKAYIEQVRGVDCSGVVTTLCQRGLIEERGRLDLPGRPLVYGTTPEFLKCFCISSLEELPQLPEKEQQELMPAPKEGELLPPQQEKQADNPQQASAAQADSEGAALESEGEPQAAETAVRAE